MFRPAVQTDRQVWVLCEDRSTRGRLTEWHWVDRGYWVGRVQYVEERQGRVVDRLLPQRWLHQCESPLTNAAIE